MSKSKDPSPSEVQIQKSPAEFFAEHQAIAGFDNLGKSLYTSIRELVENSLDACESANILPEISVHVTEYTQKEFNKIAGLAESPRKNANDRELFHKKTKTPKKPPTESQLTQETNESSTKKRKTASQDAYFRIVVQDNGCGMEHNAIPHLLGKVLSGSKYGVRQTRGKFGLGAKMALIWSKKSSGQPVRIQTAHRRSGTDIPTHCSVCVLDIDISKNEPIIMEHTKYVNKDNFIGTRMELLIAGNWTTYRSRIVQYIQQLAIITPYAYLQLDYENISEPQRNLQLQYQRRSEQMPPPAATVKHHPSSVNNIIVQQLIQMTRAKTLVKFLSTELASVSPAMAKRLIGELNEVDEEMDPRELTDAHITRLVQLLKRVEIFKAPDGSCLSPLGEYNLNLGIQFVQKPDLIATARDKPAAYEGHPFLVEAAVSLGGKTMKEGITVVRFANRIPLLFESGADVSTRVANSKIKWSSYKIDFKRDKIGVYVSIVSTKIPFKGTSKEYIGDDATEIQQSVKRALQSCCQQLKVHLVKRTALKDAKERSNRLRKYIPDVSRSLHGILEGMRKRREEGDVNGDEQTSTASPSKRLRLDPHRSSQMIQKLRSGEMNEALITKALNQAIRDHQPQQDEQIIVAEKATPLFLVPLYNLDDPQYDVHDVLFTFRPIQPILNAVSSASSPETTH
ncbi:hypothetical protein FisN_2Hh411 [Fistulifera solaris]|uniref:DNA topoisomerase VI subunit B transducer domain-containing protein n=1 Tax=Fistulifera solaris TaxID=1519565 RepID=A0A1Z5KK08_FISSO|nr:hypothetical protein FisN_2Hh411 [Fistulifera solaris]|eukprot:GAX26654.1 hypothetical protein FisN_2Hh411 [Fistulifera solaris]